MRAGHGDATVVLLLGADGDQVLIRREPVDGIQSKVAVAIEIDKAIHRPGGAADDDEATLGVFFARAVVGSGGDGERSFLVFWIVHADGCRLQVGSSETAGGRFDELLDATLIGAANFQRAGQRKTCCSSFHAVDDRLSAVICDERNFVPETNDLTEGIHVDNQIFIERDSPATQKAG